MAELVHRWQQELNVPRKALSVLLLDYSKAFDGVGHSIRLRKLSACGVPICMSPAGSHHFCVGVSCAPRLGAICLTDVQSTVVSRRECCLDLQDSPFASKTHTPASPYTNTWMTVLHRGHRQPAAACCQQDSPVVFRQPDVGKLQQDKGGTSVLSRFGT